MKTTLFAFFALAFAAFAQPYNKPIPSSSTVYIVTTNGTGQYKSFREASLAVTSGTIQLLAGTYNETNYAQVSEGVNVIGAGMGLTILNYSNVVGSPDQIQAKGGGAIITSDRTLMKGLTVNFHLTNAPEWISIGLPFTPSASGSNVVTFEDVEINGLTDCFFLNEPNNSALLTFRRCKLFSYWDFWASLGIGALTGSSFVIEGCTLYSDQTSKPFLNANGAYINSYPCNMFNIDPFKYGLSIKDTSVVFTNMLSATFFNTTPLQADSTWSRFQNFSWVNYPTNGGAPSSIPPSFYLAAMTNIWAENMSWRIGSAAGTNYSSGLLAGNAGSLTNVIYLGNGSGGVSLTTNSSAPGNTSIIRVWVTVTNSTGGVFKMPLYQ